MNLLFSLLLVFLTCQSALSKSFYLPGVNPNYFENGDKVRKNSASIKYSLSYLDFVYSLGCFESQQSYFHKDPSAI
jgi:hypothetical protein